jgi:O-antigen biosynthesis protein
VSDPPDRSPGLPTSPTEAELLKRLREAEGAIEALQAAVRSQESLADRLTAYALQGTSTSAPPPAASPSGTRTSLRSFAGRVKRKALGSRKPNWQLDTSAAGTLPSFEFAEGISDIRYEQWIELYDTLSDDDRDLLMSQIEALASPPLISIVCPVFNAPEDYLRLAIESVRSQIYGNWELCLSNDCSTDEHVAKILDEYADEDDRIKVIHRETNGHISESTNSAIALATGDWICLMDHDDELAAHALAVAVLAIADAPDAGILYSDEDHIDEAGVRNAPYFKPDFDPLLILGQNYFSHICMIRSDLIREVGGFRKGYEGSQDWDLVLRVTERLRPEQVIHVPHILYHWRAHSESTASSFLAKPYVVEASRMSVQDHLDRIGIKATADNVWGSSFNHISWELPEDPPKVSVILLPRDGARLVRCIESVRLQSSYPNFEMVMIDDRAFRPPMRQFLRDRTGWLTVLEQDGDLSDSAQRNFAARGASGDILCFLHDDIEVFMGSWLEEMVGILSFPGVGACGAKLLYPDLSIQHAGIVLGIGGTIGNPHRLFFNRNSAGYSGKLNLAQCPSAVSWACLAVRRDAFEAVGGFSESHFNGVFGDVDFCLRLNQAGWRTGWSPQAELIHHELPGDSRATDGENAIRFDRDIRRLTTEWGAWMLDDPAYNPNLSLAHESFPLAWPPRKSITTAHRR